MRQAEYATGPPSGASPAQPEGDWQAEKPAQLDALDELYQARRERDHLREQLRVERAARNRAIGWLGKASSLLGAASDELDAANRAREAVRWAYSNLTALRDTPAPKEPS